MQGIANRKHSNKNLSCLSVGRESEWLHHHDNKETSPCDLALWQAILARQSIYPLR